ncbi:hypothetical protein VAI2_10 [Vibrio phage VAI2]|uniref:Uncharacterized protein n=1 Tax=Vibrio phage VAI1 TaxID=2601671 RepID=A0A7D0JHG5_9VIRU|nr:hypothetical protein QII11_gp11 [Vibrio phage VAI1]QFG06237.1 hypothetical protein VAI2_10 [Vibrio phage VAI2]QFG06248.1 hypothetical protein VAI1_10 [Vibrio phage VAI1]
MALERVGVRLASAQTLARYACEYTVNADSSTQFTPVILDGGLAPLSPPSSSSVFVVVRPSTRGESSRD